jgi:hypothetical protein
VEGRSGAHLLDPVGPQFNRRKWPFELLSSMPPDSVTAAQNLLDGLGQCMFEAIGEVWQRATPVPVLAGVDGTSPANVDLAAAWVANLGTRPCVAPACS